ncbi:DUF881 domain-containing protein [Aeromicrobium sp. Leaf350]|uniref:DUF881 domain-containing protein n=1 Tax=Aeromicrobium sp. Leaf350 TaxID=2876565 RepID=UPI001E4A3600|nr:DUF881 domain-containing protein [Aeromicrobium sp. Leaf350]
MPSTTPDTTATEPAPTDQARRERTPYSREATGLLDQIAERALDDDYYVVRPGRYSRSRGINTAATALVLALFMLMVTITAVQYAQDRPSRSETRDALLSDIEQGQSLQVDLLAQVASLESEVDALRGVQEKTPEELGNELAAGASGVTGDGVRITIDPASGVAIGDGELRALVNELWIGGAEAIAVNGQRWGALTSLRAAGGAITINFTSIGAPYVLEVVGDRDTIRERLDASGEDGYWERRQSQDELTYDVSDADDQVLPAAPDHRTTITRATPVPAEEGAS